MRVHVDVTAGDIAAGRRRDPYICPVALALGRALSATPLGRCGITARPSGLRVGSPHGPPPRLLPVPPVAFVFMLAFDEGKAVAPIAFDLEVPDPEVADGQSPG